MTHDPRLEQVLAAILTGAHGPLDDDPRDYEPDPPSRDDEERGIAAMEDRYEREMDARWD